MWLWTYQQVDGETDGNGYAFAKLDILEWHTEQ
jgi:hypothetical protein